MVAPLANALREAFGLVAVLVLPPLAAVLVVGVASAIVQSVTNVRDRSLSVVPRLVAAAVALSVLKPVTIPVGVVLLAHAWAIPELYAARGANVLRPVRRPDDGAAERVALGLLGDLLAHDAREVRARTGLVMEPGRLGIWLLGEAGALLVRPGGRRVHCYCVRVTDPELPPSDRTAHLLLALREDEAGFATVANLAFAGAVWRLRRRVSPQARAALEAAGVGARATRSSAT